LKGNDKDTVLSIIKNLVFIFVAVSIIRVFLAQAFNIPSGSMKPTLLPGDFILVNKLVYGEWSVGIPFTGVEFFTYHNRLAKPDRGDVIVFKYPKEPKIDYIKRIIGLPGDVVAVVNDVVYLNGKPLKREYVGDYVERNARARKYIEYIPRRYTGKQYSYSVMEIFDGEGLNFGPIKVPEGYYFVLGDNRDNSKDSRVWGFVPDKNIIGQAFVIYFSLDTDGGGIRFNRIGKVIR